MSDNRSGQAHVFRVDRFVVPMSRREEFIRNMRPTNEFVRTLPGFVQGLVLERSPGPLECAFVTLVEWDGQESFERAKSAVMGMHRRTNFNPGELMARLGVKADRGDYLPLEPEALPQVSAT